jgi:DNA polymerase III subunit beta
MEIRLDRNEFLAELAPMQSIAERKSTIPVLSHLLLTTRDGRLQLAATDLDVSLTSWAKADVELEGGIAVQAKKFTEIIRSLESDRVTLRLEEPKMLTITAANSRFKIHGHAPEDFPSLPTVEEAEGVEIPFDTLRGMISKVLFAISADESRFQLNGALLKLNSDSLEIAATDGHRLAVVENPLETSAEESSVLVPRKALQELQRFDGSGNLNYRRGQHHLSFQLGRRELICRILEGTFPDYEQVIAKDQPVSLQFDRKHLIEAVHRVALMTADRSRGVRFQFGDPGMTISVANPDLGEAAEEVACEFSGEGFELGLNPDYVNQFLQAVETDQVRLQLKDGNSQCLGSPVEGHDKRYLCVIMPMRL